ncbi:hypothetical protein HHL16_04665 [Pseudoflavitalea sp. G-6-1-2]|uniref:hypothetical protein n=1 Tax=Pseudoflavitalea sp. G-6-1-2 TaxID=2728841 RepID=UPI00146A8525|nr:hypothetical protein [Pseudoflavitalea sp. G-6-1-2]NML20150.1 hypothetical protein [Pseudoflavitalea sp. G-6-1-2]
MGLDLSHIRLCEKTDDELSYLYSSDFEHNPEFLQRHQHLVNYKIETSSFFHFYIFKNAKDKTLYESYFPEEDKSLHLIGSPAQLSDEIRRIEAANNLLPEEKFMSETTYSPTNNIFAKPVTYTLVLYAIAYEKVPVFYYREIGYQRKGMTSSFYEDFENNQLYFKKADVQKAALYVDQRKSQPGLKDSFQQNFIDNFIEGESIFWPNW